MILEVGAAEDAACATMTQSFGISTLKSYSCFMLSEVYKSYLTMTVYVFTPSVVPIGFKASK